MTYIAGQITCRECGNVELLIKHVDRPWVRVRRCAECGSKHTDTPQWWPVEDVRAVAAAMSADIHRDALALTLAKRKAMN